eukprot:3503104-Pleurochrysis_carterae.AAC.2
METGAVAMYVCCLRWHWGKVLGMLTLCGSCMLLVENCRCIGSLHLCSFEDAGCFCRGPRLSDSGEACLVTCTACRHGLARFAVQRAGWACSMGPEPSGCCEFTGEFEPRCKGR